MQMICRLLCWWKHGNTKFIKGSDVVKMTQRLLNFTSKLTMIYVRLFF